MRYWAIEPPSNGEAPTLYIEPPIHRELLCALSCLSQPNCRETASDRVERKVAAEMLARPLSIVTAGTSRNTTRDPSDIWYEDWIVSRHDTCCSAIKEAVLKRFRVKDNDESVRQRLTKAYRALQESKDPAVHYFIRTLTYLPEGSQRSVPDALPKTKWLNADDTVGWVITPAGTVLGAIEELQDEAWEITPYEDHWTEVTEIAKTEADAENYLVNLRTMEITVTVHGQPRNRRIIDRLNFILLVDHFDPMAQSKHQKQYELEFWDKNHYLDT